jgi:hypothetical protein
MTSISSKNFIWNWWATKLVFALIFFTSCSTPKEIGSELFSVEVGVNYTDSITVESSTVLLDSIYGDHSNVLLLGSYSRPDIGTIESSFYSQLSNTDSINADANSIYKSFKMGLVYSFYIGDTSKTQSFTIHQLTDTLDIRKSYLTTEEVGYDPNPLASINFKPNVYKYRTAIGDTLIYDTLYVDLTNTAFGQKMFDYYKKTDVSAGGYRFRQDFKGLYFKTNNTDKASSIVSFNPGTSVFQLSYLKAPTDTTQKKITFYFALNDFFGNETQTRNAVVKLDRSQSYINNLVTKGSTLKSADTRHMTFVSSAAKLGTIINLPYLSELAKDKNIAINKAELIVPIVDGFDLNFMMSTMNLAKLNSDNTLKNVNGSIVAIPAEGSSSTIASSGYDVPTNSFSFNVTTLVQNIISQKEPETKFVILPTISTQLNGKNGLKLIQPTYAAINSTKIKLKVYYSYIPK